MKRRRNGEIILRHIALRDGHDGVDSKPVTVAVFGDNAEMPFAVGNGVSITNVYPWQNVKKAKHSLGMKKISRLEVSVLSCAE